MHIADLKEIPDPERVFVNARAGGYDALIEQAKARTIESLGRGGQDLSTWASNSV